MVLISGSWLALRVDTFKTEIRYKFNIKIVYFIFFVQYLQYFLKGTNTVPDRTVKIFFSHNQKFHRIPQIIPPNPTSQLPKCSTHFSLKCKYLPPPSPPVLTAGNTFHIFTPLHSWNHQQGYEWFHHHTSAPLV